MIITELKEYFLKNPNWYKNIEYCKNEEKKRILQYVKNYTSFLPDTSLITTRIWHIENELFSIPVCSNCHLLTSWDKTKKQYRMFCSVKCASNSTTVRDKIEKTNTLRYGGKSPITSPFILEKMKKPSIIDLVFIMP